MSIPFLKYPHSIPFLGSWILTHLILSYLFFISEHNTERFCLLLKPTTK